MMEVASRNGVSGPAGSPLALARVMSQPHATQAWRKTEWRKTELRRRPLSERSAA